MGDDRQFRVGIGRVDGAEANALALETGPLLGPVEGGGELNWSLLRLGLVDELIVTVAPKIAGGRLATTLVEGDGFDEIAQGIRLQLKQVERKKTGELVLCYRPL